MIEHLGLNTSGVHIHFGCFHIASVHQNVVAQQNLTVHQNVVVQQIAGGKMQQRRKWWKLELAHVVTNGKVACRIQTAVYLSGL